MKIKQPEFHGSALLVCYHCLFIKSNPQALPLISQK